MAEGKNTTSQNYSETSEGNRGTTTTSVTKAQTQKEGFRPQTRRQEQRTVDPFWKIDRSQQPKQEHLGASCQQNYTAIEEGEIGSETDQAPSIREVPAMNWAKYMGVKSVQFIKMSHALRVITDEPNNWDFGNAVRETEKMSPQTCNS